MRTGLGYGYGLGLIDTLRGVSILTLPDILVSGESATVAGTSNAEGQTLTFTINGQTFGTDVVSGGAWSIAAAPTDAMKGNDVAVVASVAGVTAESTTHVLPSGIVAGFDARLGVDTTTAYLNPDVTTWNITGTSVGGDASGYVVSATGGGTVARRVYTQPTNSASNHSIVFDLTFAPGVLDWIRLNNTIAGINVWVNIATGEVGTQTGATAVVTDATGGKRVVVTTDTWSLAGYYLSVYGADSDGDSSCTANASDVIFTIWDVSCTQTRATDITAQFPVGTEPVASQATAESQPAYDDASLDFDGTDDYMMLGAGLGAHQNHTLVAVIENTDIPSTGARYLFDSQTGRLALVVRDESGSPRLGWRDPSGTTYAAGEMSSGYQVVSWVLPAGGTGAVYANGVEVASGAYTAATMGTAPAFGASYVGVVYNWKGGVKALFGWPSALSSADRAIVETALADVHGVSL